MSLKWGAPSVEIPAVTRRLRTPMSLTVLTAAAVLLLTSSSSVADPRRQDVAARDVAAQDVAAGTPAGVGRIIYVSPSGSDGRSRIEAADQPVATIGRAIRLARPGDTIVVQGGTYVGPAGYAATPGRADAPIRLRNADGQRVTIKGTLQLDGADYWQVSGINVTQDPHGPRKEFLVKFDGGTGWQFVDAEVWGGKGVSNLMISGSAQHGAPKDYLVAGDCIHANLATGDAFMNDHDIYLMPGYGSGPGVIEHNLIFDAPNGAGIKAAGPTSGTGASRVTIRRNTIARTAAGVIVGYGSNRIRISDNLIGQQLKRPPAGARYVRNYDAAVIGNHVSGASNQATGNVFWGFARALHSTVDSSRPVRATRARRLNPDLDGASSCSAFHPADPAARRYGRFS